MTDTMQAPRAVASEVSASTTSAQSAVLSGADIVASCTAAFYVLFGANPTATASCMLVPANTPRRFTNVKKGDKFAVLLGASTATVQYFEAL